MILDNEWWLAHVGVPMETLRHHAELARPLAGPVCEAAAIKTDNHRAIVAVYLPRLLDALAASFRAEGAPIDPSRGS